MYDPHREKAQEATDMAREKVPRRIIANRWAEKRRNVRTLRQKCMSGGRRRSTRRRPWGHVLRTVRQKSDAICVPFVRKSSRTSSRARKCVPFLGKALHFAYRSLENRPGQVPGHVNAYRSLEKRAILRTVP